MAEEITILIDEAGNVQVEGHGFVGQDCKQLTADLEAALGAITRTKTKPEYHRTRATTRKVGA